MKMHKIWINIKKHKILLTIKPVFNVWPYIFVNITVNVLIVHAPSGMRNPGLTLLWSDVTASLIHGMKKGDTPIIHLPLPCREEFLRWLEERRVWASWTKDEPQTIPEPVPHGGNWQAVQTPLESYQVFSVVWHWSTAYRTIFTVSPQCLVFARLMPTSSAKIYLCWFTAAYPLTSDGEVPIHFSDDNLFVEEHVHLFDAHFLSLEVYPAPCLHNANTYTQFCLYGI